MFDFQLTSLVNVPLSQSAHLPAAIVNAIPMQTVVATASAVTLVVAKYASHQMKLPLPRPHKIFHDQLYIQVLKLLL